VSFERRRRTKRRRRSNGMRDVEDAVARLETCMDGLLSFFFFFFSSPGFWAGGDGGEK
jgi:hypothetical protein